MLWRRCGLVVAVALATSALGAAPSNARAASQSAPKPEHRPGFGALSPPHRVGLGKVLTTRDGGQVFGWDIDATGEDGVLASAQDSARGYRVSVETFDQKTASITRSFARHDGPRDSYAVDGVFAGDVGLVTHYVVPKGSIYAKRRYDVMNPVTAQRFTGTWTPPVRDLDVRENAENQDTTTSVVYAIELKHDDAPDLVVSDIGAGTGSVIRLDPDVFGLDDGPQLAQDTRLNQAVVAYSPDGGAAGGQPPVNALVDLGSGTIARFSGFNNGPFHAGSVNGLAVDSSTHVACTTTELNAQVEFYNVKKRAGIVAVQLPGAGAADQLNSGAAVASDPVHHLFLVADPVYEPTGTSAIVVYDEHGNVVEAIPGFEFSDRFSVEPIRVAVNPRLREGFVDGPEVDQLQQFSY